MLREQFSTPRLRSKGRNERQRWLSGHMWPHIFCLFVGVIYIYVFYKLTRDVLRRNTHTETLAVVHEFFYNLQVRIAYHQVIHFKRRRDWCHHRRVSNITDAATSTCAAKNVQRKEVEHNIRPLGDDQNPRRRQRKSSAITFIVLLLLIIESRDTVPVRHTHCDVK